MIPRPAPQVSPKVQTALATIWAQNQGGFPRWEGKGKKTRGHALRQQIRRLPGTNNVKKPDIEAAMRANPEYHEWQQWVFALEHYQSVEFSGLFHHYTILYILSLYDKLNFLLPSLVLGDTDNRIKPQSSSARIAVSPDPVLGVPDRRMVRRYPRILPLPFGVESRSVILCGGMAVSDGASMISRDGHEVINLFFPTHMFATSSSPYSGLLDDEFKVFLALFHFDWVALLRTTYPVWTPTRKVKTGSNSDPKARASCQEVEQRKGPGRVAHKLTNVPPAWFSIPRHGRRGVN
ncbi:hypothetical protein B0H11DRAFT_70089 [Mycena galericulata]|nr:hypothetical protein B0H11DRAFT_70089 [Mycena galericulata]